MTARTERTRLIPTLLSLSLLAWLILALWVPGPVRIQFGSDRPGIPTHAPTWLIAVFILLVSAVTVWSFRSGHARKSLRERRGDLAALLVALNLFGIVLVLVGGVAADVEPGWIPLLSAIAATVPGYFGTHGVLRRLDARE
ncbi:hypothetical protein [Mycetocola spongiae]|uniref:hypothetical protein n=1 Tax=Mycetocola spongiae TaxID=2859226 RepID=UPI001CF3BDEE|nr:hypothetical protein [Mycetocola spongiae]UCR90405.1 hypothetical protein KXZ72_07095 [Mycetocola spongiae]